MTKHLLTSRRSRLEPTGLRTRSRREWPGYRGRWLLASLIGCMMVLVLAQGASAAGTGSISGTVTNLGGTKGALNEIFVAAYNEKGEFAGFGVTEATGNYTIPELSKGNYKVEFSAPAFATQYYKEKSSFAAAELVPVAEGAVKTGINAALKELGRISGTVTEAGGAKAPIAGVQVEVSTFAGEFVGEATTNAKGQYEVVGLETGEYRVGFFPSAGLNFAPQYYNLQSSFATAEPLPVKVEQTSVANAKLEVGGEILGRVTDAGTGAPIAGIVVFAITEAFEGGFGFAETNANGEYRVIGLATGSYGVEFASKKGSVQYFTQRVNGVAVKQGRATPGINVALVRKAPVNTVPPDLFGPATVGQPMFCSTGSWTGVQPITFSDEWLRDGSAIGGASGNFYVVQPPDQGHALTCRVTAKNSVSSATATSNTVKVPPPAQSTPPPPPPTIENVSQSHSSWREGNKLATYARKKKAPVGTTFKFALNQTTVVSFAFTQQVGGRKVKGKCIAQTKANRRRQGCKRTVTQGTLTFNGHSGLNTVAFQGRVSSSKKLPLGAYTLRITAVNSAGNRSSTRTLNFTIVK